MAVNFASNVARNAHDKTRVEAPLIGSLFEVIPSGRALGAEVWNVDIRSFDDWAFAALMRALLKHQVLLVRGQTLSEHDVARFRRRLGPASVSFVPSIAPGIKSSFTSLHAVYDALPPALRKRIAHLKIRHAGCNDDNRHHIHLTVQPLVGMHPDTGRSMVHMGDRSNASLVGLDQDDSDAVLDELWQLAAAPQFAWDHACRPGDLVISDPRCTMPRPAAASAAHSRLLHRAEIWSLMSLA
jgi:taurine dioxygenase